MRRSEYEAKAAAFRAELAVQAGRPREQREYPDAQAGEWLSVPVLLTCHTLGCPHGVQVRECLEQGDGLYRAHCGDCDHPITDIMALYDDGPVQLPAFTQKDLGG